MNKKEDKRKPNGDKPLSPRYFVAFIAFAIACSVLYYIVIAKISLAFIRSHELIFLWGGEFLLTVLFVCSLVFAAKKMDKTTKLFVSVYVLLLFCLVLLVILVNTDFFDIIDSVADLQNYISQAGGWTWVTFLLLQFLQVVILPIPGTVSTAVGLALFGPVKCFFLSLAGIVAGSLVAFLIGRKLGYKAVVWLVGEEDLEKWMKKLKGKDSLVLTLMFLFPLFPDDILCFVAGLSSMSFRYFAGMTLICRAISVAATCFSLNFIPFNTWWGILIWAALALLILAAFMVVYKNLDRIQDKIKTIRQKNKKTDK